MYLDYQPLPVLQFLLKKTNDRQKSRTILGGVDSTYSPGDIRVKHHPLKQLDIASLLLCSIKEIASLPLEVLVI